VRRSQQKQKAKQRNQPETNNTKEHQTNQTKQKTGHANKTNQNHERRSHKHQQGQRTTKREARPNKTRAQASKQGKSGRPGRQQRQEGECSTSQEGGRVQLERCPKGILDHPRANTSVPERGAHEQHPQHGVEGKAPHRAEAFVAIKRSEDRSQSFFFPRVWPMSL